MTTTILCPDCGRPQPVQLDSREETYTYRGESIATRHEFFVCTVCGTEISTAEQADKSLESVRDCYRSNHNLVTPDEIRAIRSKYGAGQKPFGLILGLGEGTIATYERGELPTAAHSSLIRLVSNERDFRTLYAERRELIGRTQQRRIDEHLQAERSNYISDIDILVVRETPDEYTGFRKPDPERLMQLFGVLAAVLGSGIYKTKLLKLAFLCDYEFFRKYTVSISGCPYARLPYGLVPQEYKLILDAAEQAGYLQSEDFDDGKTVFRAGSRAQSGQAESSFSRDELGTVYEVAQKWKDVSASELSTYTHSLPVWQNTKHAEEMSYVLAFMEHSARS